MFFIALILVLCSNQILASPLENSSQGLSKNRENGRIIGGNIAYAGQFPFLAAVYYHTSEGTYFCGGTLLNAEWVLTAGHCAANAVQFTVILGSYNLDQNDTNLLQLSTDSYVVHPDFNPLTLENDIGLIQFRMPVEFTTYIQPVFLPTIPIAHTLTYMTMGWGQISDSDGGLQERINWVYVVPITNEQCRVLYGSQIKDGMACAEGNYNEGICYGDTGGPLLHHESRVQIVVDGVSSFISQNGCETTDPSGYTRVFPYNDWIRSVTGIATR